MKLYFFRSASRGVDDNDDEDDEHLKSVLVKRNIPFAEVDEDNLQAIMKYIQFFMSGMF
jgi:hypothetical protein